MACNTTSAVIAPAPSRDDVEFLWMARHRHGSLSEIPGLIEQKRVIEKNCNASRDERNAGPAGEKADSNRCRYGVEPRKCMAYRAESRNSKGGIAGNAVQLGEEQGNAAGSGIEFVDQGRDRRYWGDDPRVRSREVVLPPSCSGLRARMRREQCARRYERRHRDNEETLRST
jgi:hypothetical protein